jgi:hypothetical protein
VPSRVCGVWKPFIAGSSIGDPSQNCSGSTCNNGVGSDAYPTLPDSTCDCTTNPTHCTCAIEKYGAEVSWNINTLMDLNGNPVSLISGHIYRAQVMVHDGDQNQNGGDVGEDCVNFRAP